MNWNSINNNKKPSEGELVLCRNNCAGVDFRYVILWYSEIDDKYKAWNENDERDMDVWYSGITHWTRDYRIPLTFAEKHPLTNKNRHTWI